MHRLATGLLALAAVAMAWVTYRAAVDLIAEPGFAGVLRLVIEAIVLLVLLTAVARRVRGPDRAGEDEPGPR